ncbi:MAG TPA: hypothetical protein VJ695_02450 [Nitrososphaera sp.]|jgi:hypothetical protein|nr:hypothetical protein [Nitrososphaera sp.]
MKTLEFECDDQYEAEKLASLMSVQKDNTVWVSGVEAVVGNEIVVQLKDRSSHSVLLKDEQTVIKLNTFLQELIGGRISIQSSSYLGPVTGITILD